MHTVHSHAQLVNEGHATRTPMPQLNNFVLWLHLFIDTGLHAQALDSCVDVGDCFRRSSYKALILCDPKGISCLEEGYLIDILSASMECMRTCILSAPYCLGCQFV